MPRPRPRHARPRVSWRRTLALASVGGLAFWVVNFGISLTPIAAEYRAALSIAHAPMLLEALAGGLVVGLCVAYPLQRWFEQIPPTSPVLKALVLSGAAILAVTVLIEVPAKLSTPPSLTCAISSLPCCSTDYGSSPSAWPSAPCTRDKGAP